MTLTFFSPSITTPKIYVTTTKVNVAGNLYTCSGRGAYDNNKEGIVGPDNIFSIYERHLDDKYKNIFYIIWIRLVFEHE